MAEPSKKAKSTNLGLIMEREEKRELYRLHCSSEENNVGKIMRRIPLKLIWKRVQKNKSMLKRTCNKRG